MLSSATSSQGDGDNASKEFGNDTDSAKMTANALKETGGLRVDTAPLDAVLCELRAKTAYHEKQISRLQDIERIQSQLQRDSNRLTLSLSSVEAFRLACANSDVEDGEAAATAAPAAVATAGSHPPTSRSEQLGLTRVQGVLLAQQRKEKDDATLRQLQKQLVGVKAIVQQLQTEHDEEMADSIKADDCIASLKGDVMQLRRDVSSSATLKQVQEVQTTLAQIHKDTEQRVTHRQNNFRTEIDDTIRRKLVEIKAWYTELETLMQQKQAKLDDRMSSAAKASSLAALQESVESEAIEVRERLDVLTETADTSTCTLTSIRCQMAVAILSALRGDRERRILCRGWNTLVSWQKKTNETKTRCLLQCRLTRKVLKKVMLGKRRWGFTKWVEVVKWQRRKEARREAAVQLMQDRIVRATKEPTQGAFTQWRRLVLIDKINAAYQCDDSKASSQNDSQRYDSSVTLSCLPTVVEMLKDDAHGSAQALTQEIQNMRRYDIGRLRADWDREKTKQAERIHDITSASLESLTSRHDHFEERVKNNVEEVCQQLSSIQSNVEGLHSQQSETSSKLVTVDKGHGNRIDRLYERSDTFDKKFQQLELGLARADERVTSLEEDKEKANEAIDDLQNRMKASELRHEASDRELQSIVRRFEAENSNLRESLQKSHDTQIALRDELGKTQSRLSTHENRTQSALDRIRGILDSHGVRKPKLVKMIELCVLYERTAKEKNYVVTIDTVFDGNTNANLPDHIAAFAFDYATWIAYQADHELLLQLVSGSNPEELVYSDDDLGPRRRELLESLKTDLCLALGAVHHDAGVLKLQARRLFVSRLMEGVDAALSKHDTIIIETNSRIGKLRSSNMSLPVCVACDRPLRTRNGSTGRRNAVIVPGGGGGGGGGKEGSVDLVPSETFGTSEGAQRIASLEQNSPTKSNQKWQNTPTMSNQKRFTMKCGFRMPVRESDGTSTNDKDRNAAQKDTADIRL